jgi:hypothetical protein
MGEQTHVIAKDISLEDLHAKINNYVTLNTPGAPEYRETLHKVVDMLSAGCGGCVIIVLHDNLISRHGNERERLRLTPLDTGIHTVFFRHVAKNIRQGTEDFDFLLEWLSAHNESDRWEPHELEKLRENFGHIEDAPDMITKLEGQPKDGAILMNHEGTVKGAALYMKYPSDKLQLMKRTAKGGLSAAGTRHNSTLGMAEWLGYEGVPKQCPGVLFVRSDGGGAKAFFPQPRTKAKCSFCFGSKKEKKIHIPDVLHFQTRTIPTQKEMLEIFRERILQEGKVYWKSRPVLIRSAVKGETVITLVNGRVTMEKEIPKDEDNGSWKVVRAPTPDQELYALPSGRVTEVYEAPIELDKVDYTAEKCYDVFLKSHQDHLHAKGWQLYRTKPDQQRIVYQVSPAELKEVPGCCFTLHDKVQYVKPGDLLAMPFPKATELYYMNKDALLTGYSEVPLLSQEDMLRIFKSNIKTKGVLEEDLQRWIYAVRGEDLSKFPDALHACFKNRGTGPACALKETDVIGMDAAGTEIYLLSDHEKGEVLGKILAK